MLRQFSDSLTSPLHPSGKERRLRLSFVGDGERTQARAIDDSPGRIAQGVGDRRVEVRDRQRILDHVLRARRSLEIGVSLGILNVGAGTKVNTVGSKVNNCDGSKVDSSYPARFPFGPVGPQPRRRPGAERRPT
jgi:hypothetical protein